MPTVEVNIPQASYSVQIEPGLLARAGETIIRLCPSRKICVASDDQVAPIYLKTLCESFQREGVEAICHVFSAGEKHKTLASISSAYDTFLTAKIDRRTPVIALGGGVVGDMAGFVAATLLRGMPFVQIPTTLLAMVDASVGGKTGVDHAVGKNLIGAFHQPRAVLIDPSVLSTLPARELRSGLAECIKHDIIRDAQAFATLRQRLPSILSLDRALLTELITHNVAIKAAVVAADPFENGDRAHLNFGHTFGHAIESVSQFSYAHGQAVSLGMVAASRLACDMGMIDTQSLAAIIDTLSAAELPTGKLQLDAGAIMDAMMFDKKTMSGRLGLILPARIGHVVRCEDVNATQVRRAIESLRD